MLDYLQSYEWYAGLSGTDEVSETDVVSGAPDELVCVRDWISGRDYEGSVGTEAVMYSTILAKFSFLYKSYDSSLATECLQKASAIYSQSGNVVKSDSAAFRALAELYRASGESAYEAELVNYKDFFSSGDVHPDEGYMYGAMTYIVTRQAVDKELCDMLVDSILADAQSINNRKREITDPMYSQTGGSGEMIGYIRTLMCANYILKGYEYDRTMQMMLHYLSGLNVESSVYTSEENETGFYYLQSRYYDPALGRFINADDIDYLGADGTLTGYSLFSYCGNNPVMGYDPEGAFNWNTFIKGASIALVGITAIASVCTAGCAAPALAAAIAIASGVAYIGFGAAEVAESFTD